MSKLMKNLVIFTALLFSFAFSSYAQQADTVKYKHFSFEANISSTNLWLLNGVAYGLNEPNFAINLQYSNPLFYAYAYKANSLVKPVSDGNYAMLGVGHKHDFKTNTSVDVSATAMFMQYHKFYEGYKADETQLYFTLFVTQQLVANKHYLNVQPVYVVFPGYEVNQRKEMNGFLLRTDYEYRNAKVGTFNAIYYFNDSIQNTPVSNALGLNYLKRFPMSPKVTGKVTLSAIKNLGHQDIYYFQNVISVGYSIEL